MEKISFTIKIVKNDFSNGGNQVSYPIQISTTAPNGGVNGMNGIAPPSFEPSQVDILLFMVIFRQKTATNEKFGNFCNSNLSESKPVAVVAITSRSRKSSETAI